MQQSLAHIALIVRDYDEAIDFYVGKLGFVLLADDYQPAQEKRWVLIAPPGSESVPHAALAAPCAVHCATLLFHHDRERQ